ncbi:MAG: AAA family ATPase [Planctomycetota bacterium]
MSNALPSQLHQIEFGMGERSGDGHVDRQWIPDLIRWFRGVLDRNGLSDWNLFFDDSGFGVEKLREDAEALRISEVRQLADASNAPFAPDAAQMSPSSKPAGARGRPQEQGVWLLEGRDIAIARVFWFGGPREGWLPFILSAAPSPNELNGLYTDVKKLLRSRRQSTWAIVGGCGSSDLDRPETGWDDLVVPEPVRERIEGEVLSFFKPNVAELYEKLKAPYRRGVLMYGPPGNGKTSLIKLIGSQLKDIPAQVLRPARHFDDDDLGDVVQQWIEDAPAMLIIEDLDTLFSSSAVTLSGFLNLVDGVGVKCDGGLLLIATTNHPDRLDAALNNRPGRLDTLVEVGPPEEELRELFLGRHLREIERLNFRELVKVSDGLSYAQLEEVVRSSGMIAAREQRDERTADDVRRATVIVLEGFERAKRDFAQEPGALGFFQQGGRDTDKLKNLILDA